MRVFILFFLFLVLILGLPADEIKTITLKEAIKLSLKNNFQLRKARFEVLGASYDKELASSMKMPSVSLEVIGFAKNKIEIEQDPIVVGVAPNQQTLGPFETFEAQNYVARGLLSITQPLYTGGQIRANFEAAESMEESKMLLLQQTKEDLIYQTIATYYNVIRALSSFEVEGKVLKLSQENLSDIENKFKVKAVSKYELIRAQTDVLQAEAANVLAEKEYEEALIRLAKILHVSPDFLISGKLEFKDHSALADNEIEFALKNRHDLKSFSSVIYANSNKANAIKGEYLPQVALVASAGAESPQLGDMGGESQLQEIWRVGVAVNWKIFDGNRKKNRILSIENEQNKLKAEQELLKENIKEQIRITIEEVSKLKKIVKINQSAFEKATEVYELVSVGYKANNNTQLELLDARLQISKSYREVVNIIFQYELARLRLEYLTGRLDEGFNPF